jgi:SAM-dependent methyltransferase
MRADEFEIMDRVEDRHWWYRGLRRMVAAHGGLCDLPEGPRVLDAGCGTGAVLQALAPRVRAVGVDLAPLAIRLCRRRGLASTAVGSALRLPFAEGSFDAVVSCDVLCHKGVTDRPAAVREMARVLRPGGVLIMNLPAYPWLLSSHDLAVANDRRFSRGEVLSLVRQAGLRPVRATHWNSVLFPPIAAIRLWRKMRPARKSDLADEPGGWSNAVLSGVLALECALIRWVRMPFGLSIFVVARKVE